MESVIVEAGVGVDEEVLSCGADTVGVDDAGAEGAGVGGGAEFAAAVEDVVCGEVDWSVWGKVVVCCAGGRVEFCEGEGA